jgi:hypothetical protein
MLLNITHSLVCYIMLFIYITVFEQLFFNLSYINKQKAYAV